MGFNVRGYVTRVNGWTFKIYSNSKRLHINNHQSIFFYLNIFVFRNITSFGNIRRCLATTTCKHCFALYVIHLVLRRVFSMFLLLMYSAELNSSLYVYIVYIVSAIFLKWTFNGFATTTTLSNFIKNK